MMVEKVGYWKRKVVGLPSMFLTVSMAKIRYCDVFWAVIIKFIPSFNLQLVKARKSEFQLLGANEEVHTISFVFVWGIV